MNIYVDLETIPSGDRPTINDLKVPGTMSKPETIQKWKDDKEAREADLDEIYRKRALSITESQVICVAYAIENNPVVGIMRDTEKETMEALRDALLEHDSAIFQRTNTLIGFNGKAFDFPILFLRACKYHVSGLVSLFHVPRPEDFHKDVMLEFGLNTRGFMISMEKACKYFGIPSSKESIDGSQVYDYYLAGKGNEILKYCMADVEAMRKLWKELNFGAIQTI